MSSVHCLVISFTPIWILRTPTPIGTLISASPFSSTITLAPEHSPFSSTLPVMTSQYSPPGKLVNNFTFISNGSLLKAVNPRVPRLNAIWFFPLFQKLATGASRTTFLNTTMLRMAGQRCSHTQPFTHWPVASDSGEIMWPSLSLGGPAVWNWIKQCKIWNWSNRNLDLLFQNGMSSSLVGCRTNVPAWMPLPWHNMALMIYVSKYYCYPNHVHVDCHDCRRKLMLAPMARIPKQCPSSATISNRCLHWTLYQFHSNA